MSARLQMGYNTKINKWIILIEDGDTKEQYQALYDTMEDAKAAVDYLVSHYEQETGNRPITMPNPHMN